MRSGECVKLDVNLNLPSTMSSLASRKLRAPQADGAALIEPPLAEVPAIIAANRKAAVNRDQQLGMRQGYCENARRALMGRSGFTNPTNSADSEVDVNRPVIMAGHQPTLFHPGVWFKNFLLSSIGKHIGGAAINLVVDTDTIRTASIRVPTGSPTNPYLVEVPFDGESEEVPWEERYLLDPRVFKSFLPHVHEALLPLDNDLVRRGPLLLNRLWPHAERAYEQAVSDSERVVRESAVGISLEKSLVTSLTEKNARPGQCLAMARHQIEQELGLATCEVPLSSILFWHHFAQFAELLIRRHDEFQTIHNVVLAQHRGLNHIRSRSHPVPDLVRDGEWVEVPLWLWSRDNPRRRRVFARNLGESWEITDREGVVVSPDISSSSKIAVFLGFAQLRGIKIRPRALITTMYARLVLSDLFIHGIGGAKYDELTDEIIRRFFGIEPPRYLTATATFRLPIERPNVTIEDVRNSARKIRDVRYRPEALISHPLVAGDPALARELQSLVAEKRDYVRSNTLRRGSSDVFDGLDRLNESMHEKLKSLEAHLRAEHARLLEQLQQARSLGSREFSFVLFPEDYLVPRLLALSKFDA
jgi:hypothetical protein